MSVTRTKKALPKPASRDLDNFILPHNLEAERATLGAALIDSPAADYISDKLTRSAYFRRAHQIVFDAVRAMREKRVAIDFITLKEALAAAGKLDDVGGPAWLSSLSDGVPRSTNVEYYSEILLDLQAKRDLVAFANRTIDLVGEASHNSQAILEDTDRRLMELQAGHAHGRMMSLAESSSALMNDLDWRVEHRGELTGVETGFPSVNELTLGWQPTDLIIIGARPSIGKTTVVMNSLVACARSTRRDGTPRRGAVFSLEMRRLQLEYRMLSSLSGVPLSRLLGGFIGDPEYAKLSDAIAEMGNLHIEIDDRAGQSALDIRAACRRMKAEAAGLDLVVIDYIQLMPGSLDRRESNRNAEITDISRRLKVMAGELDVPVIVLSQLSRAAKDRTDPRPKLSDLRESGALEQDADIVAFLHRKNHREGGITNFILDKQRNGPTGTVNLSLDRDIVTFTDAGEATEPEPEPAKPRRRKG